MFDQLEVLQFGGGNVDPDVKGAVHLQVLLPFAQLAHCIAQHPVAQVHDHAGFLGQGNELVRHEQTALRVVPPDQRLHTLDPAGREVHHRLVVQG
ncbi:hypothetical protein SRABI128_04691 [Microbacterium sp. Bi128]|nr:hypothetical protein SRABI128_04691 [Microbacterium sp. Bi128]